MSSNQEEIVDVGDEVKQLVSDIIAKNNLNKACTIKYYAGSQAGDGYSTKTYAVDVTDSDGKSLNLFLKCALDIDDDAIPFLDVVYAGEIYFYKTIYPAYKEFLESKGVTDGFQDVPVCYGYNEKRRFEILALENLRKKGYTLFDRFTCVDDEHLKLILLCFAKFHAISFAVKDQRKELHDQFCKRCPNLAIHMMPQLLTNAARSFIGKLDATKDKDILDRCDNLDTKIHDQAGNMNSYLTDHSILTKGDCNVNNMMVSFQNGDRADPKLMLIDWQGMTLGSPLHDFGGLFYCLASKEACDNYKHYMQAYHKELSKRIRELGSDPEVLYPFSVFEKEWIHYGLTGLGWCLAGLQIMLTKSKDAPTFESGGEKKDVADLFAHLQYDEEEYLRRTKYVIRHMIDIGVI